jgi:hypothetical protein
VLAFLLTVLLPCADASHQDKNQSSAPIPVAVPDRFVGVWKLREIKPASSEPFHELLTIENQGTKYRFTTDGWLGKGVEFHTWYVTEMKGETVQPMQTNGQATPGTLSVKRKDSSRFKVEGKIQKDVFTVSADGQTMTCERTFSVQTRPNILRDSTLLFDRQK